MHSTRLLIDTPAFVRRPVGAVTVSGADRAQFLHSLLSQRVEGLATGEAADFLYLDVKANPKAAGRLVVRDGDVVLLTPPEVAEGFAAELAGLTFLMDAAPAAAPSWAMASARGPEPLDGAALGAPDEPMHASLDERGLVLRDRSGGLDVAGEPAFVDEAVGALGLLEASPDDWERWRVHAGEPAWGAEIAPGRRPQEMGLLPTHVHLDKGCYPGQESIAKMYNLGRQRRALCVAEFDAPLEAGTEVATPDGSAVEVASGDGVRALVIVPLDDGELRGGGALTAGGVAGRVLRRVGEGLAQPGAR